MANKQWNFCHQEKLWCTSTTLGFLMVPCASTQLLGRKSIQGCICKLRKFWGFQVPSLCSPPSDTISILQGSCGPVADNTGITELCRCTTGQTSVVLSFFNPDTIGRGRRQQISCISQWVTGGQNPPLYSQHIALAPERNISQGQAPREKSSGHVILSLPLCPFSVLASWGTGQIHDHLSGRVCFYLFLFSYRCLIPLSRFKKHHYTRKNFEHMLKCCPEHGQASAHV